MSRTAEFFGDDDLFTSRSLPEETVPAQPECNGKGPAEDDKMDTNEENADEGAGPASSQASSSSSSAPKKTLSEPREAFCNKNMLPKQVFDPVTGEKFTGINDAVLETVFTIHHTKKDDNDATIYSSRLENVSAFNWAENKARESGPFLAYNKKYKPLAEMSHLAFAMVKPVDIMLGRVITGWKGSGPNINYSIIVHSCVSIPGEKPPSAKDVREVYTKDCYNGLAYNPTNNQEFFLVRRWKNTFFSVPVTNLRETTYAFLFENTPAAAEARKMIVDAHNQSEMIYWIFFESNVLVATWEKTFPFVPTNIFKEVKLFKPPAAPAVIASPAPTLLPHLPPPAPAPVARTPTMVETAAHLLARAADEEAEKAAQDAKVAAAVEAAKSPQKKTKTPVTMEMKTQPKKKAVVKSMDFRDAGGSESIDEDEPRSEDDETLSQETKDFIADSEESEKEKEEEEKTTKKKKAPAPKKKSTPAAKRPRASPALATVEEPIVKKVDAPLPPPVVVPMEPLPTAVAETPAKKKKTSTVSSAVPKPIVQPAADFHSEWSQVVDKALEASRTGQPFDKEAPCDAFYLLYLGMSKLKNQNFVDGLRREYSPTMSSSAAGDPFSGVATVKDLMASDGAKTAVMKGLPRLMVMAPQLFGKTRKEMNVLLGIEEGEKEKKTPDSFFDV